MARFDVLFKKYVKNIDYKYNPNKPLLWNENNLKRMAFLEHSCHTLFSKLASTFGEDYAEFILERVLKKDFTITQFDKFPLKEFENVAERVVMVDYLNKAYLKGVGNIGTHTLITFYTSVVRELISMTKKTGEIELYDFFICLGLMIEKWVITEYPTYITKRMADVETLLKQFVKHVVLALFVKYGERQNITLAILDKKCFNECIKHGDYSVVVNKDTGERITATYKMYLNALRFYFDIVEGTQNSKVLVQPAIRTYAFASNKIKPEFLECIATETNISIGVINDIFKHVSFDAHPQDMNSPEYREAMDRVEELTNAKIKKGNVNFIQIRAKLKEMFSKDYINYLNVVSRELAYFLNQREIEKNVPVYETVFLKKVWDISAPKQKGIYSEVTIDYNYVSDGCASEEEYKDRLYKAVIDAQAINQMRVSLHYPAGKKPTNLLNVKLDNCPDDMKSYSYAIMSEATEYLCSTYQLPFAFDLMQRVFFRDKSRVCYLLL